MNQYSSKSSSIIKEINLERLSKQGFKNISETSYVVNESGSVISLVSGKEKKQFEDPKGYRKVMLSINGKQYFELVHRLVAKTFIPNPNNYPTVNHIDGNKSNNHVSNLEWCTYKHNEQDKRKRLNKSGFGLTNANAKFSFEKAETIRRRLISLPYFSKERALELNRISEEFGISKTSIRMIVTGQRWSSEEI